MSAQKKKKITIAIHPPHFFPIMYEGIKFFEMWYLNLNGIILMPFIKQLNFCLSKILCFFFLKTNIILRKLL